MKNPISVSTTILRGMIYLVALGTLSLCALVLLPGIESEMVGDFDYGPIILGVYVTVVPFFLALYQSLNLLKYIDKGNIFSELSVRALSKIKYCAYTISGIYATGMPYIFYVGDRDDAPGIVAFGFLVVGTSFVVATLANVFEKIIKSTIKTKEKG